MKAPYIQNKIKGLAEVNWFEHVRLFEDWVDIREARSAPCPVDRTADKINPDDIISMLRQIYHIRAGAAADVQRSAGRQMLDLDQIPDLRRRNAGIPPRLADQIEPLIDRAPEKG